MYSSLGQIKLICRLQGEADESVDAARLLGGAGERVVFQLNVTLTRLQAVLNYEGQKCQALSQVGTSLILTPAV